MARISTSLREQKKQNIVDLAKELLEESSYHDITLDVIARRVGMTKSNLYHYFGSKEELYLEVFLQHLDTVIHQLEIAFQSLEKSGDFESVAEVLAAKTCKNIGINDVGSLLSTTLTRNISDQDAVRLQECFNNATLKLTKMLLMALPSLNVFQVEQFLDYFIAFKNGLWAEFNASEKYQKIQKGTTFASEKTDFKERLKGGIVLMLKGLCAEN